MSNDNQETTEKEKTSELGSSNNSNVAIKLALITLVGGIITAIIALFGNIYTIKKPLEATQAAEVRTTIANLTATIVDNGGIEPVAIATNTFLHTSSVTSTYTSTAFPLCPNVKVEKLELFISTKEWISYFPGQDGKFNLLLEKGELGDLVNLIGHARLVNDDDCICQWEGSTQHGPLQTIDSFDECGFSIDLSNISDQNAIIDLKLVVGSQSTLFTITKGEIQ